MDDRGDRHAGGARSWRAWLATHRQRIAYALVAAAMLVAVGAIVAGGVVLHRAADIERQAQRTQGLGSSTFRLQDLLTRGWANGGVTPALAAERKALLASTNAAFQRVGVHDHREYARLEGAYAAYIRSSNAVFSSEAAHGVVTAARVRRVESRLSRLEALVDTEYARLDHDSRVADPEARLYLILGIVAVGLLVGLLIWQFLTERRAGRIDRDHARRSEELIRLRDAFVASVSHELRTPLTSIVGYLDLLMDNKSGVLTAEDEALLAVVQRNADRLIRLVSDLLLVAQVDGGGLALDVRPIDLGTLAAECVEAAKPAAEARDIRLMLNQESAADTAGDPLRIAQVMDNLVSNAVKFTPSGGRVTVRTGAHDGHVTFTVADTGPGISADDRLRVFDRFFRTSLASEQAVPGTGLGLTIAKAIVEAHDGTIDVVSTVGAGTTFAVELPVRR